MPLPLTPLRIHLDGADPVDVTPLARDMALAERDYGVDYTDAGQFRATYATALAALSRLHRSGEYTGELPDTVDALMDRADVQYVTDDEDPAGKDLDPGASIG